MEKKILLLDIDHTLMDESTPRPYLKEFIERMAEKFTLRFYTAASRERVTEICRVLFHGHGLEKGFVRELQRTALTRENCEPINYYKPNGGVIQIKCLKKASKILNVSIESLLLLDDNPSYDHPNADQIIQAEGFMKWDVDTDDYLKRVEINESDFKSIPVSTRGADAIDEHGNLIDFKTVPPIKLLKNGIYGKMNQPQGTKFQRNEPCSCGSGVKHKKCCMNK